MKYLPQIKKTEAETRVRLPETKECLRPPDAGRRKEESSPRGFGRNMVPLTP